MVKLASIFAAMLMLTVLLPDPASAGSVGCTRTVAGPDGVVCLRISGKDERHGHSSGTRRVQDCGAYL